MRSSDEAVVAGITGTQSAPATLLLGRYDSAGRLRYLGRTAPLPTAARAEIAALVTLAREEHPWPTLLPPGWTEIYSRREPLPYLRLQPSVVVEVAADLALTAGRWRHPVTYLRLRPDLRPGDVTA